MKTILPILVFSLLAATCPAQVFLPLEPGDFWSYRLDGAYRLTGYTGHPVATSSMSWGAVKALFRD